MSFSPQKTILVVKFGGTSVATPERLEKVSEKLKILSQKHHLVAVVSAMAGVTNQLVSYCDHMAPFFRDEEVDVVLSSGEQVTSGLLALKLKQYGLASVSLLAWQAGIKTTSKPTQARIQSIDVHAFFDLFNQGIIPIVAGFQGINKYNRTTTLGRGGSDTTAVAIAAALQHYLRQSDPNILVPCDIYTDVDGVYSADPRFVKHAKKIDTIFAPYMLELAQSGSKVLHPRSVQLCFKYGVNVRVLSSFSDELDQPGTLIHHKKENEMEQSAVMGIAHQQDDYMLTVSGQKKDIQQILKKLSSLNLIIDLISMVNHSHESTLTCMIASRDFQILQEQDDIPVKIEAKKNKVKITLVGIGLQNDTSILSRIYDCVESFSHTVDLLSVSELKIAFVTEQTITAQLLEKLHNAFSICNQNVHHDDVEKEASPVLT